MTRDQAINRAEVLRKGSIVATVGQDNGQRITVSVKSFESINLAKQFTRGKACVALKKGESFPPQKQDKEAA